MSSLYLRHEQNHVNFLHYFQYTVGYVVLLASKVPDYNCDFAQLSRYKKNLCSLHYTVQFIYCNSWYDFLTQQFIKCCIWVHEQHEIYFTPKEEEGFVCYHPPSKTDNRGVRVRKIGAHLPKFPQGSNPDASTRGTGDKDRNAAALHRLGTANTKWQIAESLIKVFFFFLLLVYSAFNWCLKIMDRASAYSSVVSNRS